jgi:2'-5' RNA ligase
LNAKAGTRRVFFALWPDAEVRAAIASRREASGERPGRPVPDHNLHATLVFLGDQSGKLVEGLIDADRPADAAPFSLRLDRFGWFARARVAWLGGPAVPAGERLVAELAARVRSSGIEVDRRPWVPHVTLFRNVRRRPSLAPPEPLVWPVARFALVESVPNRPYQVLRTWPLQ